MRRDRPIQEYINAVEAFNRITRDMASQGFDVGIKVIQQANVEGGSLANQYPIYHVMFDIKDHKA